MRCRDIAFRNYSLRGNNKVPPFYFSKYTQPQDSDSQGRTLVYRYIKRPEEIRLWKVKLMVFTHWNLKRLKCIEILMLPITSTLFRAERELITRFKKILSKQKIWKLWLQTLLLLNSRIMCNIGRINCQRYLHTKK